MKKLLLSLNNFLLISLSILSGLLLYPIMQNQQHNKYIIELNQRAPILANEFQKLNPKIEKDFYYSIYSINEKKIISTDLNPINNNSIKFNYYIPNGNDFLLVSIYEKELNYKSLVIFVIYITLIIYVTGFVFLYVMDKKTMLLKKVEKFKYLDSLTNLFNKIKFTEILEKRIKEKGNFYVIVTDIEDFKRINQISGYETGDLLLKNYAISLKLKKIIKNPARTSGNQFIFFINEKDIDVKNIEEILNNMTTECYIINDFVYNIKQKIGYVKYTHGKENYLKAESLIKYAEIAMHEAKESSHSIELYQDLILEKISKNNLIKRELISALDKNELFLVFQPKINLLNNEIYAEVLIRWKNEKLGFVPPEVFIEIAEKTGEIYKLGKWIFEQAIREIAQYKKEGKYINLSVNLSPKQLINKNIYSDFYQLIKNYDISPRQVTLEITESIMLERDNNIDLLNKFSQAGFQISIDDFGKGYSSLSYLKDFPINEIKLDKNFVDDIDKPFNEHLVKCISVLTRKLNMSLVIEGVETIDQEVILKRLGCYFFQGYLYSKPLVKEDFRTYIEGNNFINKK